MLQFVAVTEMHFLGVCMYIVKFIKWKLWSIFPRHSRGFTCRIWDGFSFSELLSAVNSKRTYFWNFLSMTEYKSESDFNLLKPTGHVMHQQFNIQQLYALPTQYLCIFYLSENKQRLVPLTA